MADHCAIIKCNADSFLRYLYRTFVKTSNCHPLVLDIEISSEPVLCHLFDFTDSDTGMPQVLLLRHPLLQLSAV